MAEAEQMHARGFFGKGSLSRGFPEQHPVQNPAEQGQSYKKKDALTNNNNKKEEQADDAEEEEEAGNDDDEDDHEDDGGEEEKEEEQEEKEPTSIDVGTKPVAGARSRVPDGLRAQERLHLSLCEALFLQAPPPMGLQTLRVLDNRGTSMSTEQLWRAGCASSPRFVELFLGELDRTKGYGLGLWLGGACDVFGLFVSCLTLTPWIYVRCFCAWM